MLTMARSLPHLFWSRVRTGFKMTVSPAMMNPRVITHPNTACPNPRSASPAAGEAWVQSASL